MSKDTERKERRKNYFIKEGVGAWEDILELC